MFILVHENKNTPITVTNTLRFNFSKTISLINYFYINHFYYILLETVIESSHITY